MAKQVFKMGDFKLTTGNSKGIWVRMRELNMMVDMGVITVDPKKLDKYKDTRIKALSLANSELTYEQQAEEMYGGTIPDEARKMVEYVKKEFSLK